MHEPFLDTCYGTDTSGNALYTAQPGYVLCTNLKTWKFLVHPSYNMKVSDFKDIKSTAIGNPDALIAFIETQAMLVCERPNVNVMFTNLS